MNLIEIKNLTFSYSKEKIFDNLTLNIKNKEFVCITGCNSCGKTTLIKLLSGNIVTNNLITIDDVSVNSVNKELIDQKVSVFSPDIKYYSKTILDELTLEFKKDDMFSVNKIKKQLKKFNMIDKINMSPQELSYVEKQKLCLIKALLKGSKVLLLDNIFCYFDKYSKIEFLGILKKCALDNNMAVVCMITDLDDAIYSDRLIVLDGNNIFLDGEPDYIFSKEKELKKIGLRVPLNYELLNKLRLYDLVKGSSLDLNDMVMELCN